MTGEGMRSFTSNGSHDNCSLGLDDGHGYFARRAFLLSSWQTEEKKFLDGVARYLEEWVILFMDSRREAIVAIPDTDLPTNPLATSSVTCHVLSLVNVTGFLVYRQGANHSRRLRKR